MISKRANKLFKKTFYYQFNYKFKLNVWLKQKVFREKV